MGEECALEVGGPRGGELVGTEAERKGEFRRDEEKCGIKKGSEQEEGQ